MLIKHPQRRNDKKKTRRHFSSLYYDTSIRDTEQNSSNHHQIQKGISCSFFFRLKISLGTWNENDRLVSVVHIRRMRFRSNQNNEIYLCGVISNVTTLPQYRNQGLSRRLLQYAIDKMKQDDFDISML